MRWSAVVGIAALGCGGEVDAGPKVVDPLDPPIERADAGPSSGGSSGSEDLPPRGRGGSGGAGGGFGGGGFGGGGFGGGGFGGGGFDGGVYDGGTVECPSSYLLPTLSGWRARPIDSNESVGQAIAKARAILVGDWNGIVTTEWMSPYPIAVSFRANGSYSAYCDLGTQCCVALYWGTNEDSELKQIRIDSVQEDRTLTGAIDMVWCYPDTGCYVGWTGDLSAIDYDATGNRLRFDLFNERACCPVHVELERR